ncbi:MAG: bifunctional diaminohydroxyphosphoribosylaminopyrimidine deaminase/5-amino-6-(5-phosphoribosylamino)uracil reductase RibD [Bacteroidia bacterium]|nr:bifunctional diaminohydroxyphosphoribosylaminopyrimidine deaminase/5-amino-6-(5-phosphoribosylamino)uracil reductase RibD [Bacteroidia bacterium]NNF30265.1 bifunctional diaminohydroxyphosphoribosylaminopyrimidine deaminase/5-amino-6-(5-phosphoribosylamino)uracil reductase RibD [Flavobacteriaceae bacterium]MBT8277336.1 bifunctional diaminohydroxyphosphoribosylaminopyrimidine deaminase/5-amino-6-(5-phosphoribosylamino)uracil reductase RibD [Bacteroidia bacterium]NNJ81580.1 bifunctional diaminoh
MKLHEKFMSRCIELAKKGLGTTYPNPLVGSVIVYNGRIIGEGWHYKSGEPHAEVHAIQNVIHSNLLSEATLYVNLEPCSHFGKTPPCVDRIISEGIKKVIIGSTDPNPKVSGRGIAKLLDAGCDVTTGILKEECDALNKRFFTFQKKKRPYVILKWAQSEDGLLAPALRDEKKEPVWITNDISKQFTHRMRAEEAAILVGTNTVVDDNPSLTARNWEGTSPHRIIIDRSSRIPLNSNVLDDSVPTLVISEEKVKAGLNLTYEAIDFNNPVAKQICDLLYRYELQSLIVEGGSRTLQTFIEENLWDEAFVFQGPLKFNQGVKAPELPGTLITETRFKQDRMQHFKNPLS